MASIDSIPQNFPEQTIGSLDRAVRAVIAGGLAGVLAGAVSRISMRMVAVMSGETPGFSIEGTLFILIFFGGLGAIAGLIYLLPDLYIPLPKPWKGLAYGVVWTLLFGVLLLVVEQSGELDLLPPLTILLIFAPVFLSYGLAQDIFLLRLEGIPVGQPIRAMGIPWVAAFIALALLFAASLLTLNDYALPFPRAFQETLGLLGIRYQASIPLRSLSLFIILAAYLGTAGLLSLKRPKVRMAKISALSLLAFGAAFFASRDVWFTLFSNQTTAAALSGIFRAAGYTAMLLLLSTFPDGRFRPGWSRLIVPLGGIWALVYFLKGFPESAISPLNWPEPLPGLVFFGWLLGGVLAQTRRYQLADAGQRGQTRLVVTSFWAALASFGLLILATYANPELNARASPRMLLAPLFAFSPYLLAWVLIPAALAHAVLRRGLWAEEE